jgi:hypothetical protein
MDRSQFLRDVRVAGVPGACFDLGYRALNRLTPLMVLRIVRLTRATADARLLTPPPGFRGGFLDAAELRRHAEDPALELGGAFLDDALARGDRCFGLVLGDRLASYGWYSRDPTHITRDLVLRFDSDWTYMYKGFTLPAYRGLRLHALGMIGALWADTGRGSSGIVSFVEANNFSSLRSVYRLGYADVGRIVALRALGRYWIHVDGRCREHGFALTSADSPPLPRGPGIKQLIG